MSIYDSGPSELPWCGYNPRLPMSHIVWGCLPAESTGGNVGRASQVVGVELSSKNHPDMFDMVGVDACIFECHSEEERVGGERCGWKEDTDGEGETQGGTNG